MKASTSQSLLHEGSNVNVHDLIDLQKARASIDRALGNYGSVEGQSLQVTFDDDGSCVIEGTVKRTDWKKDYLTQTSEHPFRLVVTKDTENNCLNYNSQSSIPETKNMLSAIQRGVHKELSSIKAIREEEVLKVITRHFKRDADIFTFLMEFTHPKSGPVEFLRIENIQAGLTKKKIPCPEQFAWLEDQVDEITLHGSNLESSDIIELGRLGILVFGEVDARFQFDIDSVTGTCVVRYGFPSYFNHGKPTTEFEVRLQAIVPSLGFEAVSREKIRADITAYFMDWKSSVFDRYIQDKIVDINLRDENLQYKIVVEPKD